MFFKNDTFENIKILGEGGWEEDEEGKKGQAYGDGRSLD